MTSQHQPSSTEPQWRKSSYSNAGNQCVEVARIGEAFGVRDSKNPEGGRLTFGTADWKEFLDGIKRGDFAL